MLDELDKVMPGRGKLVLRDSGFVTETSFGFKNYGRNFSGDVWVVPSAYEFYGNLLFNMCQKFVYLDRWTAAHEVPFRVTDYSLKDAKIYLVRDWSEEEFPGKDYYWEQPGNEYYKLRRFLYRFETEYNRIEEIKDLQKILRCLTKNDGK